MEQKNSRSKFRDKTINKNTNWEENKFLSLKGYKEKHQKTIKWKIDKIEYQ